MVLIIGGLRVHADQCAASLTDEVYATERAYELVKKGVPFRDAYKTIGDQYR